MTWFKRVFLFLLVNFLVVITLNVLTSIIFGDQLLYRYGVEPAQLFAFCLVWGMGGAFISLGLSRFMAKKFMGVQVIDPATNDADLRELVKTVYALAQGAGLKVMPEVGIYDSPEINAFATGPTKSRALVAVSTGLLERMAAKEVQGVLGHEIAHVANGDMVTMTLIQGVINAFVMFLSRVIAFAVANASRGDREEREGGGFSHGLYYIVQFALEIVFMIFGSMVVAAFSRWREFRADRGGAQLAGRGNMISALKALHRTVELVDDSAQPALQTLKISGHGTGLLRLFASHPALEERIARLEQAKDLA